MTVPRTLVVSLGLLLLTPAFASAHRLDVEAAIRADDPTTIRIEAGYEDIEPAPDAKVTLTSAAGATVAEGQTDQTGVCRLPRPPAGTYTVTVDSGDGHRATVMLTVPEIRTETAAARTEPPNRLVMTAAGLALIAVLTVATRFWLRKLASPTPTSGG